jgi:Cu/Zn superoxide dismutase
MKKFTPKMFLVLLMLTSFNMFSVKLRSNMLLSAKMDNASEVPSIGGLSGTGVGTFMFNPTRDSLCINITFNNLSGSASGAHIHNGASGVNGGVAIDLTPYIVGNRIIATITGTILTTGFKSNMLKGLTYINIHTSANQNGEIRGQINLESDMAFTGVIDGAQASVATNANGYAVFNVAKHQGTVKFYVVVNGLSGSIMSAHLHMGAVGVSGGVVQDVSTYINGNTITGVFTPSAGVIASLMAGNIYINIHTAANPNGEIRGQLGMDDKIAFDGWMDGAQTTSTVAITAKGLTSLKLNTTMDTLWYNVYTTGMSGPITMAHLHNGAVGVVGGVAAGFGTATGNMITGTITGAALTTTFINNLLSGKIYSNIHTSANPNGEIRGQIYRVMREGYTMAMDGLQQAPVITTAAKGSGMVSINRDNDNAHYMLVTNGVAGFTGIHFHKEAIGQNGGVINDITTVYANSGAFGYWKSTDGIPFSPFTMTNINSFDNDSVYINLHTANNPNGEIRGQLFSGFACSNITTGISSVIGITAKSIAIYPNPTNNNFTLSFGTETMENVTVSVFDVVGKLIVNSTYYTQVGENSIPINMKNSQSGMYFVKVANGKQEVIKKLVVN